MEKNIPLSNLKPNKKAKIISIEGGHGLQRKLRVMGVREGQIIKIVTRQPFKGPVTITSGNNHVTIGRGMTRRIIVEEI